MNGHYVLKKLLLTEDSYRLVQEGNTFVFQIPRDKNKIEVKKAVESAFGVKVVSVNTSIASSKKKTIRGQFGRKAVVNGIKKAFVKVHQDDVNKIPLI
ncbi:MAG: 50S ribosomal protein L23 [Planctomycetes bacterium]|nr:50S ribosomal protein L23 [Planctomycetota bacterium]